jgi:hypothetical protein
MKDALTWMTGFPKMEVIIGIESSSVSLKFRFKINRVVIQSNHLWGSFALIVVHMYDLDL